MRLQGVELPDGAMPGWTLTLTRTLPGRYGALSAEQVVTADDRFDVATIVATAYGEGSVNATRWTATLLVLSAGALAQSRPPALDSCRLDDDRCFRAALELRDAWRRCQAPRFVVDETAYSSGVRRLQGVWCEWPGQPGSGVFHSSPVAWAWVAATSATRRHPRSLAAWERTSHLAGLRLVTPSFWGDGGAVAALVAKRLMGAGSRLGGADFVIVNGAEVVVVERHPIGDVRSEDLPWGLVPWRPIWVFLPHLSDEARALLAEVELTFIVRTSSADGCLVNRVSGSRLLTEGPVEQDATAASASCAELAEKIKTQGWAPFARELFKNSRQQAAPTLRDVVIDALTAPTDEPTFERRATPNVDAFSSTFAPGEQPR